MKKRQALWASAHDWYVSHFYDVDRGYVVIGRTTVMADGEPLSTIETASYQELHDWAGY